MLTEKGVEVVIPVLAKLREALIPSKLTLAEALRLSLIVAPVPEAEAQALAEEGIPTDDPS